MTYCSTCGAENALGTDFCMQCGQPLAVAAGGASGGPTAAVATAPAAAPPQAAPLGAMALRKRTSPTLILILAGIALAAVFVLAARIVGSVLLFRHRMPPTQPVHFITFDVPGATWTRAESINNLGQIVGYFKAGDKVHSFLRTATGAITTFDVPGATYTHASGINNVGQIVGDSDGSSGGFLRAATGAITTIEAPGATQTDALGINDTGQVVGYFSTGNTGDVLGPEFKLHGFLRTASGVFTTFDVPGATKTIASGINNAGQIVGYFEAGNKVHSFLRTAGGVLTTFDVPGATKTIASGINNAGQIVGTFEMGNKFHSFLRSASGVVTTIDIPGATYSSVSGINDATKMVGRLLVGQAASEVALAACTKVADKCY